MRPVHRQLRTAAPVVTRDEQDDAETDQHRPNDGEDANASGGLTTLQARAQLGDLLLVQEAFLLPALQLALGRPAHCPLRVSAMLQRMPAEILISRWKSAKWRAHSS